MHVHSSETTKPRSSNLSKICLFLLLGGLAFYLITEHTVHVLSALPWLILLACPLMHLFMHRHHGGHSDHEEESK